MRSLFLVALFAVSLTAGTLEVVSWNLLHLSKKTLLKKDTQFIAQYLQKHDLVVVEEVLSKKALSALTTKKVLYSRRTGRKRYKEYIGFVVGGQLSKERLRVFDYDDTDDIFERDPAMLAIGDRFGIVGLHLLYGKRRRGNFEGTFKEVKNIDRMIKYFSDLSKIPENRIVVAGDFNLRSFTIQRALTAQKVLIEEGTTVSTSRRRLAAHDYDHFVIPRNLKARAFVDYGVLGSDRSVEHKKWFRRYVSDHYPIIGVFAF